MAILPWIGEREFALVPVIDANVDVQGFPPQFAEQVHRRVFSDVDADGLDRSFSAYLRAVSYGRAAIVGRVFPAVVAPDADVTKAALYSLPSGHGCPYLMSVLPWIGLPTRGPAGRFDIDPNHPTVIGRARVALRDNAAAGSKTVPAGIYAMETIHAVTHFLDLYLTPPPGIDSFDVMAWAWNTTHPCAHTKLALGWIDAASIAVHSSTTTSVFALQAMASPSLPPGRCRAIKISDPSGAYFHFMVEARLPVDPYDRHNNFAGFGGLESEGVIVYEVHPAGNPSTAGDLFRSTPIALREGDSFSHAPGALTITVETLGIDHATVLVSRSNIAFCQGLLDEIQSLEAELALEPDQLTKRRLRQRISGLKRKGRTNGCNFHQETFCNDTRLCADITCRGGAHGLG